MQLCHFGFKPQGTIQPKYAPLKEGYVLLEHSSLVCPSRGLQPRLETFSVSRLSSYSIRCLLLNPAMRSNAGMAKQTHRRQHARSVSLRRLLAIWLGLLNRLSSWISLTLADGTDRLSRKVGT